MSEQNVGKIIKVIGPVVDVEFEPGKLPSIMNALFVSNPGITDMADNLVIEVALHLGDNACRCIAMDADRWSGPWHGGTGQRRCPSPFR